MILSVLVTLFLLASGVLATLFVVKNQEAGRLSAQVTQLSSDNNSQRSKIDSLQRDLDSTKRDLKDSDDQVQEITAHKKALADCLNAIIDANQAWDAANGVRTAAVNAKLDEVDRLCAIADKYLSHG